MMKIGAIDCAVTENFDTCTSVEIPGYPELKVRTAKGPFTRNVRVRSNVNIFVKFSIVSIENVINGSETILCLPLTSLLP